MDDDLTFEVLGGDDPRLRATTDLDVARSQLAAARVEGPGISHRAEVQAFVVANHDAALRTNPVGHLTGSAVVVDPVRGETLLMLHRKLGRWFQPGGHADGDANLPGVALREASEETGIEGLRVVVPAIDVDVHRVEPPSEPAHLHLDVRYLVLAPPGAREHGNQESLRLAWVDLDGLAQLEPPVDDSTRRLVERGLELARHLRA